jgi:diacylglycerol O-acyltransferase / wax synthase
MPTRMNDAEAVMWALESDPLLRSDFMNLTILDRPPDAALLRRRVERTLDAYPVLRQRVEGAPLRLAPPDWVDDPDFSLDYHLRRVAVPPPGTRRQLLDLAGLMATVPLDPARPLWEMTVVEGLEDGRAALVQRIHHAVTDGVGGVKLLGRLFHAHPEPPPESASAPQPEPPAAPKAPDPLIWRHPEIFSPADALDPGGPMRDWLDGPPPDMGGIGIERLAAPVESVRRALAYRLGQGLTAARRGLELAAHLSGDPEERRELTSRARRTAQSLADQVLISGGALSPLMLSRSLVRHFETYKIDLEEVRRVSRRLGAGRNAVFVAGVTGAMYAYHEGMGSPCDSLRVLVPVSLRGGTGPVGGNHFAPARTLVPLGPKEPAERLARVAQVLQRVAAEPGIPLADALAGVISLLPPALLLPAFRAQARTVDFAASIVPGWRTPRFLAGAAVEASYPMGPRMGCAVNFTLLTCADHLDLGINIDPSAITDPGAFMDCLVESFDQLLDAAG